MDSPLTISDRQKPSRQTKHLTIGCLIFPRMDQIEFYRSFRGAFADPGFEHLCGCEKPTVWCGTCKG